MVYDLLVWVLLILLDCCYDDCGGLGFVGMVGLIFRFSVFLVFGWMFQVLGVWWSGVFARLWLLGLWCLWWVCVVVLCLA